MTYETDRELLKRAQLRAAALGIALSPRATLTSACMVLNLATVPPRPEQAARVLRAWLQPQARPCAAQKLPHNAPRATDTIALAEMRRRLRAVLPTARTIRHDEGDA